MAKIRGKILGSNIYLCKKIDILQLWDSRSWYVSKGTETKEADLPLSIKLRSSHT